MNYKAIKEKVLTIQALGASSAGWALEYSGLYTLEYTIDDQTITHTVKTARQLHNVLNSTIKKLREENTRKVLTN